MGLSLRVSQSSSVQLFIVGPQPIVEACTSHVNDDPMDPSLMTKQQLLPGLDSQ